MLLIKNADIYTPNHIGVKDILIGEEKILAIEDHIEFDGKYCKYWDAAAKTVTPGFIDQHIHITGAGGKHGFASMTPEIKLSDLIACGSTTVVGLLGTDGTARSIKNLYAKTMSLESEGISAYMFTGYYGIEPTYITNTIQDDMIFIDKVLGCKIANESDIFLSFDNTTSLISPIFNNKYGSSSTLFVAGIIA